MPQLDIFIFTYENINFILSFFFFYYCLQYLIFPSIFRSIYVRRSIIQRKIELDDKVVSFCLVLLKKYNLRFFDNHFFRNYNNLNSIFGGLFRTLFNPYFGLVKLFCSLKLIFYREFLKRFSVKIILIIWNIIA